MGGESQAIDLNAPAPVAIMLVGLQGAGKTTTAAKIAKRLSERDRRRVLMASLDVKRPAAQEQLAVLGTQVGVDTLPIIFGQEPVAIAKRAEQAARLQGYDVVLLDTAGRTHIDEPLDGGDGGDPRGRAAARGPARRRRADRPGRGQSGEALQRAGRAHRHRAHPHGRRRPRRRGAVDARRHRQPIKLLGVGEKMDAVEDFHPARLADRILGMGDIVSLVEKAAETIDAAQAAQMAEKMRKGVFDLNDLSEQLAQIEKLGGMGGIMGMLPGVAKIKDQLASANLDDKFVKRQRAIISSMTPKERRNPDILKASRKKRIAAGSGRQCRAGQPAPEAAPADGRHDEGDGRRRGPSAGMMGKLGQMMGMGGGMPMPTPEQIEALQKQMGGPRPACLRGRPESRRPAAGRLQPAAAIPRPRRRQAAGPRRRLRHSARRSDSCRPSSGPSAPPSPAKREKGTRAPLPLWREKAGVTCKPIEHELQSYRKED